MRFVDTAGLEEVQAKLAELAKRGADLAPLLRDIGDDDITRILLRFEQGKAPDGSAWQPLKKRRGQTLVDTGVLRNSIQKQIYGGVMLDIGTDVSYAKYHQFGTRHIPARPFLGVSDELIQSAEDLIRAYFTDL